MADLFVDCGSVMDIQSLRYLLAIRENGSFSKAAQSLQMSHSKMAAAMARVETQLGVTLMHKTSAGVELTSIGELIAQHASKILADVDAIARDAELVANAEAGLLRLGVGTALKTNFLPELLRAVTARHPDLRVQVQVLDRDKLLPLLRARELDLIVCAMAGEELEDDLLTTPVMAAKVVVVARPEHPFTQGNHIRIAQFIESASGGATVTGFTNEEIMGVRDHGGLVSHYMANDYDVLLTLARSGACTLAAPYYVVQPDIKAGLLTQINLDWGLSVVFGAITTRASRYSPIVKKAVEYAAQVGRKVAYPIEASP